MKEWNEPSRRRISLICRHKRSMVVSEMQTTTNPSRPTSAAQQSETAPSVITDNHAAPGSQIQEPAANPSTAAPAQLITSSTSSVAPAPPSSSGKRAGDMTEQSTSAEKRAKHGSASDAFTMVTEMLQHHHQSMLQDLNVSRQFSELQMELHEVQTELKMVKRSTQQNTEAEVAHRMEVTNFQRQVQALNQENATLKTDVANAKKRSECVVCKERPVCMLLVPCNHVILCNPCYNQLPQFNKTCPLCRARVQRGQKINLP